MDILTIVVSVTAIIISTVALVRARKVASEQLELQRIVTKLQVDAAEESRRAKEKTRVEVVLGENAIILVNTGEGIALNVNIEFRGYDPLVHSEVDHLLPMAKLPPRTPLTLMASMPALGRKGRFPWDATLTWKDQDGEERSEKVSIHN